MSPPKFEIFLIFPNFLRFLVLGLSATREELVYQVCYTRYQVSFYLWWIGSVLKYCKVPKYYDQDCLKIFFLLSTLPMMIQISGKSAHLAQKCHFYQKATNKKSWKLFKVHVLISCKKSNWYINPLLRYG